MLPISFIPIKRLAGELIISQSRYKYRCMLTTRELVFQKPDMTYHLLLDDILGLVPYKVEDLLIYHSRKKEDYYKITTRELSVIHRSGLTIQQSADLILPIHKRVMKFLHQYHGLTEVRFD